MWKKSSNATIELGNQVIENLPPEEQEKLQGVNSVYERIAVVFEDAELTEDDIALGKVLFLGYLFTAETYDEMIQDLADCFVNETAEVSRVR